MTEKTQQIPLKDILKAVDQKDGEFYTNLTEEQKKAFSPWLLMRYVSSATKHSDYYLLMTNEFINCNFSTISKHPELAWRLFTVIGCGSPVFHPWVPPVKTKKGKKNALTDKLSELNPNWSQQEIDLFVKINTKSELREYFSGYGLTKEEIKEFVK